METVYYNDQGEVIAVQAAGEPAPVGATKGEPVTSENHKNLYTAQMTYKTDMAAASTDEEREAAFIRYLKIKEGLA